MLFASTKPMFSVMPGLQNVLAKAQHQDSGATVICVAF